MGDIEPLLDPNPSRFNLFPIQHRDVWDMYKKAQSCYWTVAEVDLASDLNDWDNKLTEDERSFIRHVLAFFAQSDSIVNENIATNLMNQVQWPEARCFYGFQVMMENVHAEMYATMIEAFVRDKSKQMETLRGIENYPCVKKKAEWALRWLESETATFAEKLVAFACVEGIFFSASFCAIFWLKKRGLMDGLCISNEFISRDEGLHQDFAVLLHSLLIHKLSEERILEIVTEAVAIEQEFAVDAIKVRLIGMNSDAMKEYIEFVADMLLFDLIGKKHYNTRNPFDFMELIRLRNRTNFFEKKVSEYSKASKTTTNTNNAARFTRTTDY